MKSFTVVFLVLLLVFAGCVGEKTKPVQPETKQDTPEIQKETRAYYLGIVPTPQLTPEIDIVGAYEEAGQICEVVEVWPSPSGIGAHDSLAKSQTITGVRVYGLKPIVNMHFFTFEQADGEGLKMMVNAPEGYEKDLTNAEFREEYIENAKKIAEQFKPEYFSLGNEVNSYYLLYPEDFDNFVSLYKEAYDEVKKVSPDTKVFVVFSQNQMEETDGWEVIDKFGNKLDLLVFTTYPWKFYDTPEEIPENYYAKLEAYTTKPIAFTEIGWPSTSDTGTSEKEQADYLRKFRELTKEMNLEFVNWLFLHETEISGITASVSDPTVGTIALKKSDGTEKEVYSVWVDLKNMEKE